MLQLPRLARPELPRLRVAFAESVTSLPRTRGRDLPFGCGCPRTLRLSELEAEMRCQHRARPRQQVISERLRRHLAAACLMPVNVRASSQIRETFLAQEDKPLQEA